MGLFTYTDDDKTYTEEENREFEKAKKAKKAKKSKFKVYDLFKEGKKITCRWVNLKTYSGYNPYRCSVKAYSLKQALYLCHNLVYDEDGKSVGITKDNPRFIN